MTHKKKNAIWCVYIHISRSTGKCYIGRSKNVNIRWSYDGAYYKGCPHFYSAIKKYGFNDFYHLVVEKDLTEDESIFLENVYINKYRASNPKYGYNISSFIPSDDENEKLREIKRQQKCRNNRELEDLERKVFCVTTGTFYDSVISASVATGIDKSLILKNCNGEFRRLDDGTRFRFSDKGCIDLKK